MLCVVLNKNIFLPFNPLSTFQPSVSSTVRCPLYGPLSSLWPSFLLRPSGPLSPAMILRTFYGPMYPQQPSATSAALYFIMALYRPLSSLLPSVSSTALFHSMALCPSKALCAPSTTLCLLYDPMSSMAF
jgi:hypothetical protein